MGGGGDLQIVILLKKECSFSDSDMGSSTDTQPLQDCKKIELCSLRSGGDIKTFQLSLVP